MKYQNRSLLLISVLLVSMVGCQQDNDRPEPEDFGYLTINVLNITEEEANGRIENTDISTYLVTIHDAADGSVVETFDPFSTAPAEIQLLTGEYYVEAHSNNLQDAAFNNAYYFGRSNNFTIDKLETETIDVTVELANTKVAINYSVDVTNTFQSYTATVTRGTVVLDYVQGEDRPGYFAVGAPLDVEVVLVYTKPTNPAETIERNFTTTIDDPQPKTQYTINVDASLEDGEIAINIIVDESFDEEIIDLGDLTLSGDCIFNRFTLLDDGDTEISDISYNGTEIEELLFTDVVGGESYLVSVQYDANGNISSVESQGDYVFREVYTYNSQNQIIERNRYRHDGTGFYFSSREVYSYNVDGQLITFEVLDGVDEANLLLDYFEVYHYDDNLSQNPTYYEAYDSQGINYKDVYLEYDTAANPLIESGIWVCEHCMDFELPRFTANNISKLTSYPANNPTTADWQLVATLEYNAAGLISRASYTQLDGEVFVHDFGYTCE